MEFRKTDLMCNEAPKMTRNTTLALWARSRKLSMNIEYLCPVSNCICECTFVYFEGVVTQTNSLTDGSVGE